MPSEPSPAADALGNFQEVHFLHPYHQEHVTPSLCWDPQGFLCGGVQSGPGYPARRLMKQTSTAVSPSFPHTQFSQLLFFCLNKKQRAEPQIGTRCGIYNHPPLPAILSSSHPPCGLAKRKQTVGRKGRRPCPSRDSPPRLPCVDSESSQVTDSPEGLYGSKIC